MSPQDKIMYVANKLGLSTLKDMQGTTRAIYDSNDGAVASSFTFFEQSSQHANPAFTNINDNRFEVNEALLVEQIGFYTIGFPGVASTINNLIPTIPNDVVVVFDLIIGNKTVMKQVPVFVAGGPITFTNASITGLQAGPDNPIVYAPRHQVNLEGAGILIPPQVEFKVEAKMFNLTTGAVITDETLGCYLFGTGALLNFNTSI